MANIWEKAISILAGNLNSGHRYPITIVFSYKHPKNADLTMILLVNAPKGNIDVRMSKANQTLD